MTRQSPGMTLIIKTVSRLLVGLIFLYGTYIILHGHISPGGGFGGGVILALGLLAILLAYGREETLKWLRLGLLEGLEQAGPLAFLLIGLTGLAAGGAFLANILSKGRLFALLSSGFILPLNIVIGLKVGMSLFLVVLAMAGFDLEKGADE
jgi:multisubunit Na+/H+ antiporter MnhB subunit